MDGTVGLRGCCNVIVSSVSECKDEPINADKEDKVRDVMVVVQRVRCRTGR